MAGEAPRRDKRVVLVIEDEVDLRRLLTYNLEQAGYRAEGAATGRDGLRLFEELKPDAVLLDLMLPDIAGTEVCRRMRASGAPGRPIVFIVSAKSDEIDRVVGLELGADDYIVKPFSIRELLLRLDARIKDRAAAAQPERAGGAPTEKPETSTGRFELGPLEIDGDGYHVYVEGEEVHVSALEMRLLLYLFQAPGRVRSRRDLLTHVWGYQPEVTSRTVDTHIKRLRDKLGAAGALIQTVRGLGYRLADVRAPGRQKTST